MAVTTYKINGKNIRFDVDSYLRDSANIKRSDMPQVNMESFIKVLPEIKKKVGVVKTKLRVDQIYPTQNEINMEKVLRMVQGDIEIAKEKKVFVVSRDLNIIDGHHRHVYMLIQDPKQMVDVYVVDMHTTKLVEMLRGLKQILNKPKAIHEYLVENFSEFIFFENYGQQPPAMSGGMGDVDFGSPDTADGKGEKGSGDFAGTQKKKDGEEDDAPTYAQVKPAFEMMRRILENNYYRGYSELILKSLIPTNEDVTYNADGVIESEEGIEWKDCVNIPVSRKYFKMDKPFKVKTMEGITEGKAGDYLMRGVDGELYPCDNDVFHKTYIHLDSESEHK